MKLMPIIKLIGKFTVSPINKLNSYDNYELKKELNELVNAGLSLPGASKYLAKKYSLKKSIIYNIY